MSDDKCARILATVPESQKEDVKKFFESNGFYNTVLHLVDSVWDKETKAECELMLRNRDQTSRLYQLIYVDFNVKEHFNQTDSHKLWVKKSFNRFKRFVPNVTEDDAEVNFNLIINIKKMNRYRCMYILRYDGRSVYFVQNCGNG